MDEKEVFRTATTTLIKQNPSTISITKEVYTDNGAGGQSKTTTTIPSFTGRIYRRHADAVVELVQLAGTQQKEEYVLLAPYDSGIVEPTANIKQFFTVYGETYSITTLFSTRCNGELVSKRALLKKVE